MSPLGLSVPLTTACGVRRVEVTAQHAVRDVRGAWLLVNHARQRAWLHHSAQQPAGGLRLIYYICCNTARNRQPVGCASYYICCNTARNRQPVGCARLPSQLKSQRARTTDAHELCATLKASEVRWLRLQCLSM